MTEAQCQREVVLNGNSGLIQSSRSDEEPKRLLKFDTGDMVYGIELGETIDVIRDLMLIQSYNTRSITRHFIKFNRRHTIVFNLEQCLSHMEGRSSNNHPSFVLLDEKIDDSCVGILVPGIRTVTTSVESEVKKPRVQKNTAGIKVHSLRDTGKSRYGKRTRRKISVLNLRELVDNYLLHLKYMDSMHFLRN